MQILQFLTTTYSQHTMNTRTSKPTAAHLPQKVGTFDLVEQWKGERKFAGQNWVVRCELCKDRRIVSTGMWNAAYKGTQSMKCDCQKGKLNPVTKRSSIFLTHAGLSLPIAEWAIKTGVSQSSIRARLARRNTQSPQFMQSDEWVIFGIDKGHPARKVDYEPDKDIDKILRAITAEAFQILQPRFVDAVNDLIKEKIRPLLYGLASRRDIGSDTDTVTVTDPTLAIPDGHKISKNGLSHFSTTPHVNDSEMVSMDATYLQAREYFGDEAAEFEYWPLRADAAPATGWLILPANIARWQEEKLQLKREEEKRKDAERKAEEAKTQIECLPGHRFALWRESMPSFKISDRPTPEAFPTQEDTVPLSDDEVNYFLLTPWWEKRMKSLFNVYNFGPICRTQYERIKAFHVPPQKQYPKGCDMAVAYSPSFSYCDSHRNLNEYLDFFAISEWCEDGRRKMDIEGCMDGLVDRFAKWSESDVQKVRMQADRLLDWFPALPAYIKEHCPEWIQAYLPSESDMTFLDTDTVEPTELHPVT